MTSETYLASSSTVNILYIKNTMEYKKKTATKQISYV